jgi:hypothetical protein
VLFSSSSCYHIPLDLWLPATRAAMVVLCCARQLQLMRVCVLTGYPPAAPLVHRVRRTGLTTWATEARRTVV